MHPILVRIPLPHYPLRLWWALAALAAIAIGTAIVEAMRRDRGGVISGGIVAKPNAA